MHETVPGIARCSELHPDGIPGNRICRQSPRSYRPPGLAVHGHLCSATNRLFRMQTACTLYRIRTGSMGCSRTTSSGAERYSTCTKSIDRKSMLRMVLLYIVR